jgi:hypothetical protein
VLETQSVKNDQEKPPWHLLPWGALEEIVRVLDFGAKKYRDRNWENPGLAWHRPFRAAIAHLQAWFRGETMDPESGLNHLAHAAANCLFLLEYARTHPEMDDRPRPG